MPDAKISALPDIGAPTDLDELAVNDGGTSKRMTMDALNAYIQARNLVNTSSTAAQSLGTAATYLTGSRIVFPDGKLKAGTMYRCRFYATKTAASTAVPTMDVRVGTAGTTADTSRGTLTLVAQTAALDEGLFELMATFRSVGSGTSAVLIASGGLLAKRAAATAGFANLSTSVSVPAASAGFDSTVANLGIGVSVTPGAASAWTVQQVMTELFNLA